MKLKPVWERPKKYDREDFIEAIKKKLRKEKDPVKKQFYQDIVKEFDQ
jgi:hypothetical protein